MNFCHYLRDVDFRVVPLELPLTACYGWQVSWIVRRSSCENIETLRRSRRFNSQVSVS